MLAFIAVSVVAVVLGHLVKDFNSARRDREFYKALIAVLPENLRPADLPTTNLERPKRSAERLV